MKIAIQTAKIAYPDYERESGTKWPDKHLDPAEAQLFAFAALRALDGAGFDIVPNSPGTMPSQWPLTATLFRTFWQRSGLVRNPKSVVGQRLLKREGVGRVRIPRGPSRIVSRGVV
jgi:hypothetical protein